jgi:STE24 endopeptidase
LTSHTAEEILAVLAHEVGHWKRRHILKQLLIMEAISLAVLWLASRLIAWPVLYEAFGFIRPVPFAGLLLTAVLLGPLAVLVTPVLSAIQRRFEREADAFVPGLTGSAAALAGALKRIARDNLANLHPHPLYAGSTTPTRRSPRGSRGCRPWTITRHLDFPGGMIMLETFRCVGPRPPRGTPDGTDEV